MSKVRVFLTLTGYQLTWLACVFGEIKFNDGNLGVYIGFIYLTIYLYFNQRKTNFLIVASLIAIPGYLFDTILVYFKVYEFNSSLLVGTLPPWMIILWLSFSTLFDQILTFFKNFKKMGIFLSGILGPLTYYLGEPIGVITINNAILFFSLMIFFWCLLMVYYLDIVLKRN